MTGPQVELAAATAATLAERLASPSGMTGAHQRAGWWRQSLAKGAVGVALLHVERARAGLAPWQRAHDWLHFAIRDGVTSGLDSHLHYGAPALAFTLNAAAADGSCRYARALDTLDRQIGATTSRRLDRAHARMDRRALPALAEFDAIRGLSGIGAYLLEREPDGDTVRDVLAYLVRLAEPLMDGGESLPGWWTDSDPAGRRSWRFAGGHANHGMAHGIGGPLALLSLAARKGVVVAGQTGAIRRICTWLDRWGQGDDRARWWPYWITRSQLRGDSLPARPARPSWCYGTAGLARAQQLAADALGDPERRRMAERAMVRALTDPEQLAMTVDLSMCHGLSGLLHLSTRAAQDASDPDVAALSPRLLDAILAASSDADALAESLLRRHGADLGLLEGIAGVALAMHNVQTGLPHASGWDSCLLVA